MSNLNQTEIINKINEIIDSLRIYINQDGGDLEFVKYENQIVYIKILGACVDCSLIDTTYNDGLETILKEEIGEDLIQAVKIVANE